MQDTIKLTDLIDVELLQRLQDSFAQQTGMAVLTVDANGKPVTKGSHFTRYCNAFIRKSKIGCARCEECDRFGAQSTIATKQASAYMCHSGLMDFAAPIMVDGQMIGGFIGGQVLTEPANKQLVQVVANDLGLDFEQCWQAVQEVPVVDRGTVETSAAFLYDITSILSQISYKSYRSREARDEMERVANMKTDFLANMSHEIRTPMNAVIGMAEMALREDLKPEVRDYIVQIKSSGNALLNIINDILDFSKIESGKMDITPEEYEPSSLLYDVSNILITRVKNKDTELIVSVDPSLPSVLVGDDFRLRQILINLANNAIKFTHQGRVKLDISYEKLDETHIMLKGRVNDTGIGIKKEDMGKLFESFQQVDSKRNRNVEGTGLGLAITKRLLGMMGGDISVESIYGKGSTFSFMLPQEVKDPAPCMEVKYREWIFAIGYWGNIFFSRQFYNDMKRLGIDTAPLTALDRFDTLYEMYELAMKDKQIFFFTDEKHYAEEMELFVQEHPEIQFVVLTDFYKVTASEIPNVYFLKKPLSTIGISMVLNCYDSMPHSDAEAFEFDFIAPEARVLIVDDNEVNLTVSEGLLEPLKMKITTAASGKEALQLLGEQKFDLVFMDHMMPELDGVETTRIIRRLHPNLDDMPIIALSANAVGDARKMFLAEGMNDFVAKPIELRAIVAKIRRWLPPEKIIKGGVAEAETVTEELKVGDLDTASALRLLGSPKLFWTILKKYYEAIEPKSVAIKKYEQDGDVKAYTIEVHALKSSSKQIGAWKLAALAEELELAGKQNDLDTIKKKTDQLLQLYVAYLDVFKPFVGEKKEQGKGQKKYASRAQMQEFFARMEEVIEELDMDGMENMIAQMERYAYKGNAVGYFEELKTAVGNIDVELCDAIIKKWRADWK